jgi:DNA-binding NarL/FixJ family response regulator
VDVATLSNLMQYMEIITVGSIEKGVKSITRREAEILHFLLQGKSTKEIAGSLHISIATVQKHLKNVYRKLEVHNKIEALQKIKWLITAAYNNGN